MIERCSLGNYLTGGAMRTALRLRGARIQNEFCPLFDLIARTRNLSGIARLPARPIRKVAAYYR